MPSKRSWQHLPLDHYTARYDSNQLIFNYSTPVRQTSALIPASFPRLSVAAEPCTDSPAHVNRDNRDVPRQQSRSELLREQQKSPKSPNRQRGAGTRVVSSPASLTLSGLNLSQCRDFSRTARRATELQRSLVYTQSRLEEPLPPQTRQFVTSGQFIQSSEFAGPTGSERLHQEFRRASVRLPEEFRRRFTHAATSTPRFAAIFRIRSRVQLPFSAAPPNPDVDPGNFPSLPKSDADLRASSHTSAVQSRPSGDVMASLPYRVSSGDTRRPSRLENRQPSSTVLCRNGPQCRKFVEGTCHYNHDFGSMASNGFSTNVKKFLTVESPAFTPKAASAQPVKNMVISPKAAAAATFTPRGSGTVTPAAAFTHLKESSGEFVPQQAPQFQEFVPGQSFLGSPQLDAQSQISQQIESYSGDPFLAGQGLASLDGAHAQMNPYAQQGPALGGQAFYQDTTNFKHPLNYHLYSSIGPRRENLAAFQRTAADFFIPDDLREELQRKSEAALQTFANSTLPPTLEHFHSLVALDTNNSKGPGTFGYPSWVYKAISSKDGHVYALRRVEGFRLSTEASIRTVNNWKRINNASMVQIYDAFTGRWFGDSSLIIVTQYHANSRTLAQKHFGVARNNQRQQIVAENELWGYIVQIASALKTIHEAKLAAQTVMASKVLLTSKNRLRLNGCGVFDIVQHEQSKPLQELQRADLQDLGRLILSLATRNQNAHQNLPKALELVSRSYTERLRSCIAWLIVPPPSLQDGSYASEASPHSTDYNVNTLLTSIVDKAMGVMDSTLHLEDELTANMVRELENSRLVRLLAKLNVILERPDTSSSPVASNNPALSNQPSSAWSETGERYYLKLFRDYVFHQVDHEGRPVLELGHIVTCLNKLDAGIDEKIQLMSRDELSVFITSYKEVKRGFETAWAEISKASNPARR